MPILMHFTHANNAVGIKMEDLVKKQLKKMKKTFTVEELVEGTFSEAMPEKGSQEQEQSEEPDFFIEAESDDEGAENVIVID